MITFMNVEKMYEQVTALRDVSFHVERGEFVVLIGPSGCGKTTTLKLINGLVLPTKGEIIIEGKPISEWDPIQLRRNIGYVIQQIGLFPYMSIAENISYVLKITGSSKAQQYKRAEELIQLVEMDTGYLNKYPQQLSGGQQQRIGVARALAADPDIILMDEPFGAIDQITRTILQDELIKLQKKLNKTIIFVTHDIQEAIKLGTKIALFKEGQLVQFDTPKNMIMNPSNAFVSEFFSSHDFMQLMEYLPVEDVLCTDTPKKIKEVEEIQNGNSFWKHHEIPMVDGENRYTGAWNPDLKTETATVTIKSGTTVKEGLKQMLSLGVDWLPIVTENGDLMGILCFTEIYEKLVSSAKPRL